MGDGDANVPVVETPVADAKKDKRAPEVIEVTSLSDIVTKPAEVVKPDPIRLMWKAGGKDYVITVETRYPDDIRGFPLAYVMEAEKSKTPEVDRDGATIFPNKGCHEKFLRQRLIDKPVMLKNDTQFAEFASKVPPTVLATLHRKLELIGGLDADFFVDYSRYVEPAILTMLSSRSAPGSTDSPLKSEPPTPGTPTSSPSGSESAKPVSVSA